VQCGIKPAGAERLFLCCRRLGTVSTRVKQKAKPQCLFWRRLESLIGLLWPNFAAGLAQFLAAMPSPGNLPTSESSTRRHCGAEGRHFFRTRLHQPPGLLRLHIAASLAQFYTRNQAIIFVAGLRF
jgi:hypothetical protein